MYILKQKNVIEKKILIKHKEENEKSKKNSIHKVCKVKKLRRSYQMKKSFSIVATVGD